MNKFLIFGSLFLSGCVSASAIDGKGVLGEIGEPPAPSDLYDDDSDGQPASEPSDEWDDSGWWDTGDWGDGSTWGCAAPAFGICYDMYAEAGWDEDSAEATCENLGSQYGIEVAFINDDYGCPVDNSVGACELDAGGDFSYAVTAWYDGGSWDSGSAEGSCSSAGGDFY